MLQQYTGCSNDFITTFANKISFLLEHILNIGHEDKSNKIEMLRKVESEVWYLCEKREFLSMKPKGTLMGNG